MVDETFVSEGSFEDFPVVFLIIVMLHDEIERLIGRVDNQRESVEPFKDDSVLDAQLIVGEVLILPLNPVLGLGEIL